MKSKEQLRQEVRNIRTANNDVVLRQRLQSLLNGIVDALGGGGITNIGNQTINWTQIVGVPSEPGQAGIDAYSKAEADALIKELRDLISNSDVTDVEITTQTFTLVRKSGNIVVDIPTWNQDTTGNAGSATKLKNKRKIWGREFDGTQDVEGAIENATDGNFSGKVTAREIEAKNSAKVGGDLKVEGTAYTHNIDNDNKITTKDLEAWGSVHFYEVVIDKARKTSGISLQSCASAKLDIVEQNGDVYRCYFLAKDSDGRKITNDFLPNDQILMQTFNIDTGTSYDVGNRFFWALCSGISESAVTIGDKEYHWLDIDMSVKVSNSNAVPAAEDEIVVLGHRSAAHTERQDTIIFASIDNSFLGLRRPDADKNGNHPLIQAPYMVQLQGINSFSISYENPNNYGNIISRGYNSLRGTLHSSSSSQDDAVVKVEVSHVDYYLCTATLEAPAASASGWAEAASPTEALPYIWKKTVRTYNDGTSQPFVEFVNKFQKGTDGQKGADGKDGKDGKGITFEGERWSQELVDSKGGKLPNLYAVRMADKIYIVTNTEGTANPPVWCLTDWQGRRLKTSDGGYVLRRGEDGNIVENKAEWEAMAQFGVDGKDGRDGVDGKDGIDGKDGAQGIGVKYVNVFKRGNVSQMDKPNDPSVSFDNPIPQGWSDGVPSGDAQCWISTRPFYSDGRATEWSKPVPMTDTADFDCCFSTDENEPPAPTTHGTQADSHWHNAPQEGDKWMATSVCKNGEWSKWQITQILGEEGKPAYVHTAYCNDIITFADFTVANPTGKAYNYVGTYTDDKIDDDTTPSRYKWVYVKGADAINANLRGEWREGMTLNYMDVVRFEGIAYLYKAKDAWNGYPRAKILDYQGRTLRNWTGGLLWANNSEKSLFATDSRWEVYSEDAVSLVVAKGFEVAKIKGKATEGVFTFADEQEALVELRRGTALVDDNLSYSIALKGCKGVTMQRIGSICKVNIPATATVDNIAVVTNDVATGKPKTTYLPVSDCSITVNCSYGGRTYSAILPIQIDYSDRWSEFVQNDEQFKSELNAVRIEQGVLTEAQSVLRQDILGKGGAIDGVRNELSAKIDTDVSVATTELTQLITVVDGKVDSATSELITKIDDAESGLSERIDTVDGKVASAETSLNSRIGETEASLSLKVGYAEDGKTLESKARLAADQLSFEGGKSIDFKTGQISIDSNNFKLDKSGNGTFSGDVKIGDVVNGHNAIELLKDGSGQIAKGNIEWKKNGDIILHIASENFVIDDAQLQQRFFAYLAEAFTFEIKDGKFVAIRANKDFYSVGSVAAYGKSQSSNRDIFAELDALNARISALEKGGGDTPTPTPTPSEYGVVNTDNHIVVNDTYTALRYVDDNDTAISGMTNID